MFRGYRVFTGGAKAGFRSFANHSVKYSVPVLGALYGISNKALMFEVATT